MIAIVVAIAGSVAVGVFAERRYGNGARSASRNVLNVMLYVLVPFVAFFNVARVEVDVAVGGGIALALVAVGLCGAASGVIANRVLKLDRRSAGAMIVCTLQSNTGYLGIPLVAALIGADAIGEAAAYDVLVTAPVLFLGCFAVGAAYGDKAGEGFVQRLKAFFLKNPPLLAVIAAFFVPDSFAPQAIVDVTHYVVFALAPLGFFAVGVNLATEAEVGGFRFPPPLTRPVATIAGLRLIAAPVLLTLLALPLFALPSTYRMLAAMPSGINCLIVAHAYGLDLRLTSSAIAWTTSIVLVAGLIASFFV